MEKIPLVPRIEGDFWLIGSNPDLKEFSLRQSTLQSDSDLPIHECVDHHIFQTEDKKWHLWGCIRGTPVGRILYHWEGNSLEDRSWRQTGEIFRADPKAGESIDDWDDKEWIQSPFILKMEDKYYMFYGGHGTGIDKNGEKVTYYSEAMEGQICLMTSTDGRFWHRHKGQNGFSRLFVGPGEARDPCIIKIGNLWHLYYAGYQNQDRNQPGIFVRTSKNLINWSNWRLVHQDFQYGGGKWAHECPHVVYRSGYFYLFRTKHYSSAETFVFRSENPYDFGIGDASEHFVGLIPVAAPEIITDENGNEYITSNHDLREGTKITKLQWVAAG